MTPTPEFKNAFLRGLWEKSDRALESLKSHIPSSQEYWRKVIVRARCCLIVRKDLETLSQRDMISLMRFVPTLDSMGTKPGVVRISENCWLDNTRVLLGEFV